jgi:methyl-accepting chemotaxis protein
VEHFTPRQILEIKSSFMYFIIITLLTVIATSFQILSKVELMGILRPFIIEALCAVMAFIMYRQKKKLKNPRVLSWVVGFITSSLPFIGKYNYVSNAGWSAEGWTFAVESINTTILIVVFLIALQLLYNKKIYIVYSIYVFSNWGLFMYLAYINGATMHWEAMVDGKLIHGVVIGREAFFFIISLLIAYLSYRNIPITDEFDERTAKQRKQIEEQSAVQKAMANEIKEKMGDLFIQVGEQNNLVIKFNDSMQAQASTFEEMSATLEELLGSAENIHNSSVDQIDGNVKMETIVNEFKIIKEETKNNLDSTFTDIQSIVGMTSISNEKLQNVENTINSIKEQSKRISETVSIIVEIADRINLLSLNASIEAARAGDFGRGFAVVADEIGKLAFQTTESIKEIEKVLSINTKITTDGVDVIRSTADMIKGLINRMGESSTKIQVLQESILIEEKYIKIIIEQMFKNIDLAKNIGTGTDEQKLAIENTSTAIEHVNEIVGQMLKEIHNLSETSNKIMDNARALIAKSEDAVK